MGEQVFLGEVTVIKSAGAGIASSRLLIYCQSCTFDQRESLRACSKRDSIISEIEVHFEERHSSLNPLAPMHTTRSGAIFRVTEALLLCKSGGARILYV
jgi:hypothetical protein